MRARVTPFLARGRRDRPGDAFRGWLHGITRHLLMAHLRRSDRQPQGTGGSAALVRLQALSDGATPAPDEEDPAPELNALAADLGVSSAAVRKAKSRVLHRLKEEVGDPIA
jgi:RNA polymerase sigma-70 factor (ECF subfamily)